MAGMLKSGAPLPTFRSGAIASNGVPHDQIRHHPAAHRRDLASAGEGRQRPEEGQYRLDRRRHLRRLHRAGLLAEACHGDGMKESE